MQLTHEDFAALAKYYSEQARLSMSTDEWAHAVTMTQRAQECAKKALELYRSNRTETTD